MTSIRTILFGDVVPAQFGSAAQKIEEAAERLAGAGAVPPRQEATPIAVARTVMTTVADLLNIEVSDVLVGAWRTRSALLAAARESVKQPGVYRHVTIKSYAFPWEYGMDVDVTFNRTTIATVSFTANVEVEVAALIAVIQNGRLTQISSGEVKINAAIRITSRSPITLGAPLAQGERTLPLTYEMRLPGSGVSLVDQPVTAPGH